MFPGAISRPSFGNPAVRPLGLTRGFASPSRDGFALIGKGPPLDAASVQQECQERVKVGMAGNSFKNVELRSGGRETPAQADVSETSPGPER